MGEVDGPSPGGVTLFQGEFSTPTGWLDKQTPVVVDRLLRVEQLNSFSRCCLPKSAKSREIPTKLHLTAVQGHPRSSILMLIESSYVTSYHPINH